MLVANLYNSVKICNTKMVELLQNISKFSKLNVCFMRYSRFKLKISVVQFCHNLADFPVLSIKF